jgi:hypothetical protein
MARDYENLDDIDDLSDDELRRVVRDRLAAHNGLDIDELTVCVENGDVVLGGRVGTDYERLVAEHIVTDLVRAHGCRNEILVDPIRRPESPEAVDDHLVDEDRSDGLLLGDRAVPLDPETEETRDDLDAMLYGTTDVGKAIREGTSWIPPESATQEWLPPDTAEDH